MLKIFFYFRRLNSAFNCGKKGRTRKFKHHKNNNSTKNEKTPRVVKGSKDAFRIVNGNLTTSRDEIPWQVIKLRFIDLGSSSKRV